MGNRKQKIDKKLAARIDSYESTGKNRQQGFTKPGSQNLKKQRGGADGGKRRR